MRTAKEEQERKLELIKDLLMGGFENGRIVNTVNRTLGLSIKAHYVQEVRRAWIACGKTDDVERIKEAMRASKIGNTKVINPAETAPKDEPTLFFQDLEAMNVAEKTISELGLTTRDTLFLAFIVDLRGLINNFYNKYLESKN